MKTKEWRTKDKTEWERGPWDDEPDKMQWQDEDTGLPCLIVRNNGGALCGYVGVTEGHPAFGVEYDNVRNAEGDWIEVHGGLTFSDFCAHGGDESRFVCHVPDEGEPDRVWWLGFDCAHSGDLSPGYDKLRRDHGMNFDCRESYRSLRYVQNQCARLAQQLKGT